jgi:hypothetical protein
MNYNHDIVATIVFVHLGRKRPHTLNHYAIWAASYHWCRVILITDQKDLQEEFPGEVLLVDLKKNPILPLWWRLLHYDKGTVAGGYWLNTLQRLFIFESLEGMVNPSSLIIHIESDVMVFPDQEFLSLMKKSIMRTSVVELRPGLGIASILVAPNLKDLVLTGKALLKHLLSQRLWLSDMELLGDALNKNLIGRLRALPLETDSEFLEFDGWPFGQFLFGQDGVHNQGNSAGGFISPYLTIDPRTVIWGIREIEDYQVKPRLFFVDRAGKRHHLFNVHIHAKHLLCSPSFSCNFWSETIRAANFQCVFPNLQNFSSRNTHDDNGNLMGRLLRRFKSTIGMR